jgi:hypothetical protein
MRAGAMLLKEKVPTLEEIQAILSGADKIGEGSWRTVYRVPGSRWVIKVDTPEDFYGDDDNGDNAAEYVAYLELKNSGLLTDYIKIPEMHLIGEYIVAEYIEGEHPENSCWTGFHTEYCPGTKNCWRTKFNDCGFHNHDLHSDNIKITDDDVIYIIDLGAGVVIE